VNFIELMEESPASRLGIVAVDAEGNRRDWHFGELIACSAGLSGAFAARGVKRGDVVMTLVGNRIEWVLSLLACWRMGAVALPCNTQLRRHDLAVRVAAANPALCVGEDELLNELAKGASQSGGMPTTMTMDDVARVLDEDLPQETPAAIEAMDPEDPALIVFTSGTTGDPRGVVHAYRYLEGQRAQAEHWLGSRKGELVWCTTATGWSKSARNVFLAPWLTGAAAVIHDGRFDAEERLDIAEALGVNVLCQAPTEYRMLAKRTQLRRLPKLRRMVSAGEPLEPETIAAFHEATGLEPADGYGQTETGHISGNLDGEPVRQGSMGKVLPGMEVRILPPEEGSDAGNSTAGELQLRAASSPTFFSRYLDGERFEGEWWPTGDLVREDEDGYLFFEGRDDDIILSAGYRIGPFEVESALLSHPAVAEAAAVAAPDPERGAVVRAIVVPREREPSGELARELQEHCKRETAPYKFPRIVEFAAELPKTSSGKIKRAQLRQG